MVPAVRSYRRDLGNTMTLLQQIQNEAIDSHSDLPGLLRRCRILAQRLGSHEFKEWVQFELEGYPSKKALPPYRRIRTPIVLGHFTGYGGSRINNGQIPHSAIPEEVRDDLTGFNFLGGIASIAALLVDGRDSVHMVWPLEAVQRIGQGDIYDGMYLMQAFRVVNRSVIQGILDQVQNRILNFVLELESRDPQAGEAIMSTSKIPKDQIRNIFNTTINGGVQNLAQGSHGFEQAAGITITPGNFDSLRTALSRVGIEESEIGSLELAVQKDCEGGEIGMGSRVKVWLADLALKAGTAGATAAATDLVKQFFNL